MFVSIFLAHVAALVPRVGGFDLPIDCSENALLQPSSLESEYDYDGAAWVYPAHAERQLFLEALAGEILTDPFLRGAFGTEVDKFIAIAGSFTFLTLLLAISPKEIDLVDVNQGQLDVLKVMITLIKMSHSRAGFLSLVFGRNAKHLDQELLRKTPLVTLDRREELAMYPEKAAKAEDFLQAPVDMALIYSTFATLMEEGAQVACTYGVLLQKWFAEPTALTTHERICDHIGVFGGPVIRPNEPLFHCSFQLGEGWLRSDATFNRVRDALDTKIRYLKKDLIKDLPDIVNPAHRTVVYLSNILSLGVGHVKLANLSFESVYLGTFSSGGYVRPFCFDLRCGEVRFGDSDELTRKYVKHLAALFAVLRSVQHFPRLIEITHVVPYGFQEFETGSVEAVLLGKYVQLDVPKLHRLNVGLEEFEQISLLRPPELVEASCLLHNLVGSGVSLDNFLSVLAHALSSCERTIVLEHNRESLDFREEPSRSGWFTPRGLLELLQQSSIDLGLGQGTPGHLECAPGMKDGCRNMVIAFDKLHDFVEAPEDMHQRTLLKLVETFQAVQSV
ncbi:unnamed protein product [Durusdinium trenchii]|uniref:Uncharacterized protein n=1 Tax=Durusdinium trenchii TaxID=1381693 RepID=A0ABP0MFP0_9DINO